MRFPGYLAKKSAKMAMNKGTKHKSMLQHQPFIIIIIIQIEVCIHLMSIVRQNGEMHEYS